MQRLCNCKIMQLLSLLFHSADPNIPAQNGILKASRFWRMYSTMHCDVSDAQARIENHTNCCQHCQQHR